MIVKFVIILLLNSWLLQCHFNQPLAESFKRDYTFTDDMSESLTEFMETSKQKEFNINALNQKRADVTDTVSQVESYCSTFKTCHECVKAIWYPCRWCHNYGCLHSTELLCPYTGNKLINSNPRNRDICPSVSHDGPIIVSAGKTSDVIVKLQVLDPAIYKKEILCLIKLSQKVIMGKGLIVNDEVNCHAFDTSSISGEDRGTLTIIWGGVQPFSNEVPVFVYACESMAKDCESCRLLSAVYQCGWCDPLRSCVISSVCTNDIRGWWLSKLTCIPGRKLIFV